MKNREAVVAWGSAVQLIEIQFRFQPPTIMQTSSLSADGAGVMQNIYQSFNWHYLMQNCEIRAHLKTLLPIWTNDSNPKTCQIRGEER